MRGRASGASGREAAVKSENGAKEYPGDTKANPWYENVEFGRDFVVHESIGAKVVRKRCFACVGR